MKSTFDNTVNAIIISGYYNPVNLQTHVVPVSFNDSVTSIKPVAVPKFEAPPLINDMLSPGMTSTTAPV